MIRLYAAIAIFIVIATLIAGGFYGHARYGAGKANVQAQWDSAKAVQATAVAQAKDRADEKYDSLQDQFTSLDGKYQDATNAKPPALSDAVTAGVTAGTLQLRDKPDLCPGSGNVTAATASSRAADAAATQALADRVSNSIAAVRAGDASDTREHQLAAQVTGLQGVIKAERANP